MTLPETDIPWNIFAHKELTNPQTWWSRIFLWLNGVRDFALPLQCFWRAEATAVSSLTNATWSRIALNQTLVDSLNLGLDATGGFIAPTYGIYQVCGSAGVAVTTGNRKGCQVIKNGAATAASGNIDAQQRLIKVPNNAEGILSGNAYVSLVKGDRLNVYGFQETGGAVNTVESTLSERSSLSVIQIA